jgi:hypothetical protein
MPGCPFPTLAELPIRSTPGRTVRQFADEVLELRAGVPPGVGLLRLASAPVRVSDDRERELAGYHRLNRAGTVSQVVGIRWFHLSSRERAAGRLAAGRG